MDLRESMVELTHKLRSDICNELVKIELDYCGLQPSVQVKSWDYNNGFGGGVSTLTAGKVFEKAGVNISNIDGVFDSQFIADIPGARESNGRFFACGLSLVIHLQSPLIPVVHMNIRHICSSKSWFGGGIDLTPMYTNDDDTKFFHASLRNICDQFSPDYYKNFKQNCDEYFFLRHRNESRGVGGIFFDYLDSGDKLRDFEFVQAVGRGFLDIYPKIVRQHMHESWTMEQREHQLIRRGRYVEFNLLYDRGTKFGLMTNGNAEAIMMSMPPVVKW